MSRPLYSEQQPTEEEISARAAVALLDMGVDRGNFGGMIDYGNSAQERRALLGVARQQRVARIQESLPVGANLQQQIRELEYDNFVPLFPSGSSRGGARRAALGGPSSQRSNRLFSNSEPLSAVSLPNSQGFRISETERTRREDERIESQRQARWQAYQAQLAERERRQGPTPNPYLFTNLPSLSSGQQDDLENWRNEEEPGFDLTMDDALELSASPPSLLSPPTSPYFMPMTAAERTRQLQDANRRQGGLGR